MTQPLQRDRREWLFFGALALLVLGVFLRFMWVSCTQFGANRTFLADVGVFDALCYGPLYGNWMRTPLAPDAPGNYFGIHFQPYLFLLTPFYVLFDHPLTLLTAFTASVVVAAVPLALATRALTGSRVVGLGVACLYLGNHFTISIHLANHPEALALPWIMVMFLGLVTERRRLALTGLVLALSVKEDLALFLLLFWLSQLAWPRQRRLAAVACAVCVGWGLLAMIVMKISGAQWFAENGMTPLSRFASMGSSNGEVLIHMLTHPVEMASRVFRLPLLLLVASTLGLCLLDWRGIWAPVAAAAAFMATDDIFISRLDYYYSYAALPLILFCAVRGAALLLDRLPNRIVASRILATVMAVAGAVMYFLPTRTDDGLRHRPFAVTDRHRLAPEVFALIPEDASVAAQYDIYPRVPHRKDLFPLREQFLDRVDYVAMDQAGRAPDLTGEERQRVFERLNSDEWEVVDPTPLGEYLILRKRGAP